MKRQEFLDWAKNDGCLSTTKGKRFIQIHSLNAALNQPDKPPADWPDKIGALPQIMCWGFGWYDAHVGFTLHKIKPEQFFEEEGDGCVSCSYDLETKDRVVTRNGKTYTLKNGEEDPYGASYSAGLYSYYSLAKNIELLESFIDVSCFSEDKLFANFDSLES
jgi:hypothetical protein